MESTKPTGARYIWIIMIILLLVLVYSFTGFFVTQPIGAIPDGATIWFFRSGTDLPFIASADGRLIDRGMDVSLLGRSVALGTIVDQIEDKKIMSLPYIRGLYLISTHGVEFEK